MAVKAGWAEQDPQMWWDNAKLAVRRVTADAGAAADEVKAIGISYQMHGLVCVDKDLHALRPSIIWCDSRAVPYGEKAFGDLGAERCLSHLLNSPGNFTAAKLAWVKENEPETYRKIYKVMLPGDYIAMRLSGTVSTTVSGLSEGMFWDFKQHRVADFLMDYYGFDPSLIADIVPTFAVQGEVSTAAAAEMGLKAGTPITYRGGDQPNNALSPQSRVNTFAHVNHSQEQTRLGVLLCINGTGILNAWVHRNITPDISYAEMNDLAATVPIGSEGVSIIPFGNGAERVLENKEVGCSVSGLNFNRHSKAHLVRAAQEGIVFSFCYGMEIMQQMGMDIRKIHAGRANMFLSPLFRNTLAGVSGATIELYDTDGSVGAAKGAGIGAGIYANADEAFATLEKLEVIAPDTSKAAEYRAAYDLWKGRLREIL